MRRTDPASAVRQGDVCAIPNVPIWNLNSANKLSGPMGDAIVLPNWNRTQQLDGLFLVVVCTQCCDIENPRARTGVSIAPLMKVPSSPGDERYERIMASGEVDVLGRYEYLNLFPIVLPLDGSVELVADFSAIVTMAPSDAAIALLGEARRFTMTDEERRAFREKLGFMFGRDPAGATDEF